MKKIKKILIESNPFETKTVILNGKDVSELNIELNYNKDIAGNIYKGKVGRVIPSLKSAFIDIGLEKDGYLNLDDVKKHIYETGLVDSEKDKKLQYSEKLKYFSGIKQGDEIIVQVIKGPISEKGPKISLFVSIPGKYLVLLPGSSFVGVSKKIPSIKRRKQLVEFVRNSRSNEKLGFIIRTAAKDVDEKLILDELNFFHRLWKKIDINAKKDAPRILYQELPVYLKLIRNYFDLNTKVYVNSEDVYDKIKDFVSSFSSDAGKRIILKNDELLFEQFGIKDLFDKTLLKKIWMPSGGYLVIEETEALTSIDVNSGKYVSKGSKEQAFLKINKEAAVEVARQLIIRDIGGIIIVDFIDMRQKKSREKLHDYFKEQLKNDPSNPRILNVSRFGLIEMTRKRTRGSTVSLITNACPYCDGRGYIKSSEQVISDLYDDIIKNKAKFKGKKLVVYLHKDVEELINEKYLKLFYKILKGTYIKIKFEADDKVHRETFIIEFEN